MSGRITTKYAGRNDLYDVAVLLHNCWQAEYRQIILDEYLDKMSIEERYKGLLMRFDGFASEFLMMLDGDRLIGASVFGMSFTKGYEDDGEVSAIYLRKEYIGKGLGSRLFLETERALSAKGYRGIVLDLLEGNTRAFGFYLKHGYTKVSEGSVMLGENEYPLAVLRKAVRDDNR